MSYNKFMKFMWKKIQEKWRWLVVAGLLASLVISGSSVQAAEGDDAYNPCSHLPSEGRTACTTCMYGAGGGTSGTDKKVIGFWTAIGCIPTDPINATRNLLDFMLGVGGFFVVVQILIGSFQLLTSRGNTQKLQEARERITNSVIALLFIVFSVTIIEFVGVRVLHLPGFFDGT